MEKITIVGAGLVGSLQAIYMAKAGFDVEIYERRFDFRTADFIGGRSINLALSDRGWKALEGAGIADEIKDIAIPMKGRMMHDLDGTLTFQPYGKEDQAIYSVSRGELNKRMLLKADSCENVKVFFDMKCEDIDLKTNTIHFQNTRTKENVEAKSDRIFGTDGIFSSVRLRLQKTGGFDFMQKYMDHGYKELTIQPNADGSHKLDKNCLHIWPRGKFMVIALPNLDGSFTVTLFFPFKGEISFESLNTDSKVVDFFQSTFPDAYELMQSHFLQDWHENPTSYLCYTSCKPYNYEDKVLLLGDAAHAVVPFYGQGMNSGFEDCTLFYEMLQTEKNWKKLFDSYSEHRKPDGDAIRDLALYNYIEMRDSVADKDFLLRKKIEKKLNNLYPEKWIPLYSMVTFSHIRYSEALALGKKQRAIMDEVMKTPNIHENWESQEVMDKAISML